MELAGGVGVGELQAADAKPKQRVAEILHSIDDWLSIGPMGDEFEGFVDEFFSRFERISGGQPIEKVVALVPDYVAFEARFVALEAFLSQSFREGFVFDQFLSEVRPLIAPENLAYFLALRGSSMSLYQAIDVVPKSHVVVRDVVFETDPVLVKEVLGTTWMTPGGYFAARLVQVGEVTGFSGGFVRLSRARVIQCLAEIEKGAQRWQTHRSIKAVNEAERLMQARRLATKYLPSVVAGMRLVDAIGQTARTGLVEVSLPILGGDRAVQNSLDAANDFQRFNDKELEWDWVPVGGVRRVVEATLTIEDGHLLVAAESSKSMKAVQLRLKKMLGDRLGNPIRK